MQPPQSIEEIKAGLETTEKGGVRQSIRNCLTVFQRDPLLSGAIAYNILTDRKDIIKPIGFHRESTALNDTDMKYLLLYLEETYGLTNEKTDGLYDVLAVGQDVVCDSPGKQRVTLEYGQAVPYALADAAFLGGFQSCLYFLNALGRLHGVHGVF